MRISKTTVFPLIITLILFIVPFFWFKPGEMDLGGDSSRLYFYDPASYLSKAALYSISPSSFGAEYLGYSYFPFIFLIFILKTIFYSPTILISLFYGISLSDAFLFTYLSIKELVDTKHNWLGAAVGGLLYTLSPATLDGWTHVLITYNQIFLNPLMFYLLLKYFKTSKLYIFLTVVSLTFLFSPNFSVSAAPAVIAFYPLSLLFLISYTTIILKRKIIVKHVFLGLVLFIGVQAFHLIPLLTNIFAKGSELNVTIFSDEGKFDRGFSYFSAIAPNIRVIYNLMGLPQMKTIDLFQKVFILFPFVISIAFLFNKKKEFLLTAFFFFIVLFFATANITDTWLAIYKSLFSIPGFSIFRNFYGQWQFTFIFYYSILFGQALYIILTKLKMKRAYILASIVITILLINAIKFIKGDFVKAPLWQSKDVSSVFQIDPDYEKALSYIRMLPADARVLTLPLTDPGYQIIAGKNGGAYMGPSTISYLGGKKDFAGYDELEEYKYLILDLVRNNDYETLKKVLGLLNIRYIFYNADPIVYDKFPGFPYEHVRSYVPQDQKEYKRFIQDLQVTRIKNINNKFFIYELSDEYYSPHISIAKNSISFSNTVRNIEIPMSLHEENNRNVFFTYYGNALKPQNNYSALINSHIKFDEDLIDVTENSSYKYLTSSNDTSKYGFPYVSWNMASPLYPFIALREKQDLGSFKKVDQLQLDKSLFIAEKRIAELERWGKDTKIVNNISSIKDFDKVWGEPSTIKAILLSKYNYWEVNFLRYDRILNNIINKIDEEGKSDPKVNVNKYRIIRILNRDRDMLYRIIQSKENLSEQQKTYLLKLSVAMFAALEDRLQVDAQVLNAVQYDLHTLEKGEYEIFIEKQFVEENSQEDLGILVNDKRLSFNQLEQEKGWFKVPYTKSNKDDLNKFKLLIPQQINRIANTMWKSFDKQDMATDSATLVMNDDLKMTGVMREIDNWQPKSYYYITFDYRTNGKRFTLVAFDRERGGTNMRTTIVEQELKAKKWKSHTSLVLSNANASSGYIQFIKSGGDDLINKLEAEEGTTAIDIKNMSIVKISTPKIIVRKIYPKDQQEKVPTLTFTRVNPTKYRVNIKNAKGPYTLVFLDQYSQRWKLTESQQDAKPVNQMLRHFDGSVNQEVTQDVYLNTKTFETWGEKGIAEASHFPANGYANAWYITPKDVGGKTDYTLVIEMTTQKQLYIYLAVSIFVFVITVVIILIELINGARLSFPRTRESSMYK